MLARIASFSNLSTLAILGRVSEEFLVASTPVLYHHVEIKSLEQLALLFCSRNERSVSQSSLLFARSPLLRSNFVSMFPPSAGLGNSQEARSRSYLIALPNPHPRPRLHHPLLVEQPSPDSELEASLALPLQTSRLGDHPGGGH